MPIKYWTINPSESIWGHNGECNSRIILLVHTRCKSGEIVSNKSHDKLLRFATFSSHVLSWPIHGWRWQWKPEPLRRRLEDYLRSIFNFLIIRKEFDLWWVLEAILRVIWYTTSNIYWYIILFGYIIRMFCSSDIYMIDVNICFPHQPSVYQASPSFHPDIIVQSSSWQA